MKNDRETEIALALALLSGRAGILSTTSNYADSYRHHVGRNGDSIREHRGEGVEMRVDLALTDSLRDFRTADEYETRDVLLRLAAGFACGGAFTAQALEAAAVRLMELYEAAVRREEADARTATPAPSI